MSANFDHWTDYHVITPSFTCEGVETSDERKCNCGWLEVKAKKNARGTIYINSKNLLKDN